MALNMDAAVKIKASVDGLSEITSLNKALGNTEKQAKETGGALGRIKGAAGGLSGALGGLVPAAGLAGLAALGKRSIDAADNLNDLSQRTGVGVESLSRFGRAAEDSGTSLDSVAKSMGKLAKGIVDPASQTSEALKSIGINSTDASGKIRSMDAVMLDIADRFQKLPDGAEKTALAMQLFGKSGAELIPMLNGGREALSQYSATIDTEMAQAADKFNDAINAIGASVAGPFNQAITALLPFITQMAEGIAGMAQAFSALPAPVQTVVGVIGALAAAFIVLAPAITAIATIAPIFTGIGAAIAAANIGGLIAGWLPVLTGLIGTLGTIGQTLIAVFSGPVGWVALAVAAGVAIYAFRDQIGDVFNAIGGILQAGAAVFKSMYIDPVVAAFTPLAEFINTSFVQPMQAALTLLGQILQEVAANIKTMFIDPVVAGFTAVVEFVNTNVVQPISDAFKGLVQGIGDTFKSVTQAITAPFEAAFQTVRGIVNSILQGIAGAMNGVIRAINNLIQGANRALAALKMPQIPFVPEVKIPQFAEGGVVTGPTLAMVGEGGEPEYIVPQSKASGFAANWMDGKRGAAAIPGFANGGMVMPRGATSRSAESSGMMSSNAQISIQTGPVTQMNGQNYVTTQDLSRAVQSGVQQTISMMRNDRGTRRAVGLP